MVAHGLERLWHTSRSTTTTQQHSAAGSSLDRYLNHLRQSMHFFISNLFYYLQVDVIDSEFCQFLNYIQSLNHNQANENQNNNNNCGINQNISSTSSSSSNHFQKVYKVHKEFLSKICRLSFIDNVSVMDCIDKILLICLRYIVICRLKLSQEDQLINNRYHRDSGNHSNKANNTNTTRMNGNGNNGHNNRSNNNIPVIIPIEEFMAIKKDFLTRVEYLFRIMNKLESQNFLFRLDFNGCFTNLFNNY